MENYLREGLEELRNFSSLSYFHPIFENWVKSLSTDNYLHVNERFYRNL